MSYIINSKLLSYNYNLSINGSRLSDSRLKMVNSITHNASSNGSDLLTISVYDPTLSFIEDDIFLKDATVEFQATLNNDNSTLAFDGFISALDIEFTNDGVAILTLYCMDGTYIMNRVKKSRTWANSKVSDVVKNIMLLDYPSLKYIIEDTGEVIGQVPSDKKTAQIQKDSITQSDQTDMEFFLDLASRQTESFKCNLQGGTLHFEKIKMLQQPQAVIWYKQNGCEIISFNPQINKESKKQEVKKQEISLISKKLSTSIANDMNVDRDIQGYPVITSS